MNAGRGSILVIRGGAIGDFILTLPVLAALRRHLPGNRLEVLGYPRIADLAVAGGLADAARPIESRALAGFFAARGELDPALGDYFAGFDLIVSYLYDPDRIFQTNIARCSRAQFLAGPHRPDENGSLHAAEVFLQPLQRLAVFDADSVPRMELPRRSPAGRPVLAFHPGSGSESKNWPEAKWIEFAGRLVRSSDASVLIVGGEAEAGRLDALARAIPANRCEVLRGASLAEVGARLAACDGFVGHDSGITHLAAAVGARGVALWGPSQERVWRPRSERFRVLRSEQGLAAIRVDEVLDAALGLLGPPGPADGKDFPAAG